MDNSLLYAVAYVRLLETDGKLPTPDDNQAGRFTEILKRIFHLYRMGNAQVITQDWNRLSMQYPDFFRWYGMLKDADVELPDVLSALKLELLATLQAANGVPAGCTVKELCKIHSITQQTLYRNLDDLRTMGYVQKHMEWHSITDKGRALL